jgi:hypothetical protein
MKLSGVLHQHCLDVERQAEERMTFMLPRMLTKNPPPDKGADPMGWAAHMTMLKAQVDENIKAELIYE